MKKKSFIIIFSFVLFFLSSCSSKKKLDYLQNIESVALEASIQNAKSTIQTGDQLVILITAKDMDVVKPFNQNYSSGENIQNGSLPSSNVLMQSQTIQGPTYTVETNGDIDFPVLGKISTTNKTLEELKEDLKTKLSRYIKNPIVNIRTANYKIVVLGEVNKPGTYMIPDGNVTILSALGLAGDLTIYGIRNNVLIVRNIDGAITKQYIDLTDGNFINSPFYYLKQNDVIYVQANQTKERTSRLDPNAGIYIAVASVVLGLLGLIFRK